MVTIIDETPAPETEQTETDQETQPQTGEEEQPEADESDDDQEPKKEDEETEDDSESITVSIGDDEPEEDQESMAPPWVRDLRKKHKDMKRQNQELRQQLEQYKPPVPTIGPKPTLEGCDYDADQFEKKLSEWYEAKKVKDQRQAEQEAEDQKAATHYKEKIENYQKARSKLKVRDYSEAESTVEDILDANQQTVIIEAVENPAIVVYALGKNPKRAAELAKIKNPVKFAYELSKLESTLKINKRKPATAPDKKVSGTAPISGTTDNTLERLRADAAKTGDMSKVMEYKRQKRKAAG